MKNVVDERVIDLENIDPKDDEEDIKKYVEDFLEDGSKILDNEQIKAKMTGYLTQAINAYKPPGEQEKKIEFTIEEELITIKYDNWNRQGKFNVS